MSNFGAAVSSIANSSLFRKSGSLTIYGNLSIYINGSLLTQVTSIDITRHIESQEIHLIGGGFQGITASDPVVTINVKNATPSVGFELDPGQFMKSNSVVEFTISNAGSNTINFNGWIIEDNFSAAVNSNTSLSFTAKGLFTQFNT